MSSNESHPISISNGPVTLVVEALGAKQVSLTHGGRNAMQTYDTSGPVPFSTGAVMAPWANRIRDGKWTLNGKELQLPLMDKKFGNAIHGLLRETIYQVTAHSDSSVTLTAHLAPSEGYPFELEYSVQYTALPTGIEVTHSATNLSDQPAPFGTGAHPFFIMEGVPTEDLEIHVPAFSYTAVDDRLLPTGQVPTPGQGLDPTGWRRVGDWLVDTDFHQIRRSGDGRRRAHLTNPVDARKISVWLGENFSHFHIFITDQYPGPNGTIRVVAIEPGTAGPDAFNNGLDLTWLQPGVKWSGDWGVELLNW